MGVQPAAPAVGRAPYPSVSAGAPDLVAHALPGYALLQSLIMPGRLRWLSEQPFVPACWAFSFAMTALGRAPLIMLARASSAPPHGVPRHSLQAVSSPGLVANQSEENHHASHY